MGGEEGRGGGGVRGEGRGEEKRGRRGGRGEGGGGGGGEGEGEGGGGGGGRGGRRGGKREGGGTRVLVGLGRTIVHSVTSGGLRTANGHVRLDWGSKDMRDRIDLEILHVVHGRIMRDGYKRHGWFWNKHNEETVDAIDLQKSKTSTRDDGSMTVNVGIALPDVYSILWQKAPVSSQRWIA